MKSYRLLGGIMLGALAVYLPTVVTGAEFQSGGDRVAVTVPVEDNSYIAGGNVDITGDIQGDVRVAGGQVTISDTAGGDVLVFSGDVQVIVL
jgi:hypothetical protein